MGRRGFTLIELLVVIAIIGLLSSVVLATLQSARLRAADAAIKEQASQLRTVYELEYSDSSAYTKLQPFVWWQVGQTCSGFTGNYATQAANICTGLVKAAGSECASGYCAYMGAVSASDPAKYSILVYLPYESAKAGAPRYLCMGSSGASSISTGVTWTEPGCYSNP